MNKFDLFPPRHARPVSQQYYWDNKLKSDAVKLFPFGVRSVYRKDTHQATNTTNHSRCERGSMCLKLRSLCRHVYICRWRHRCFLLFPPFRVISFRFISLHVISCHFMSFHVVSCHFMSFHVVSCHFMSFHVVSCRFMSFSCHFHLIS